MTCKIAVRHQGSTPRGPASRIAGGEEWAGSDWFKGVVSIANFFVRFADISDDHDRTMPAGTYGSGHRFLSSSGSERRRSSISPRLIFFESNSNTAITA